MMLNVDLVMAYLGICFFHWSLLDNTNSHTKNSRIMITGGLVSFCFRADASRKEFLATPCDRQPVAFSEEDPSSPKHDEGRIIFLTF